MVDFGEVAERSNATDCKSVALAASEVRILPSPPALCVSSAVTGSGVAGDGNRLSWILRNGQAGVTQW